MFPSFRSAGTVRVADLRELDGFDRLLLITLQGLVNREKPQLYLIADPVDETWVGDLGVRTVREKDPLALVDRYRDRIGGAVVYDVDVPHTINLATTIAGLQGLVVATAEQAEHHGIEVVEDLRGRFEDDPAAIHDWAMAHLWDRCTRGIPAGQPPGHTVAVDGVEWTELLREEERVTDSSNLDTYTIDLTGQGGEDGLFLKIGDSFPDDGWGGAVHHVEITADGEVLASFVPGAADEEPFLFDSSGSSTKEGLRFADGGASFVYRIEVPAGASAVSAAIEMENEFVVSATDTAPTRVEPFASFRDLAVATGALVSWLPPSGTSGSQFEELLGQVEPGTVYAGWFSNDVAGEWSGVELCSRAGVIVVAADYYMNASVLSAIPAPTRAKPSKPSQRTPEDRVYVTLTVGEGDNIQYCQRHMRELWDDPARGQVPLNWTVSPLLEDVGPAILHHFQRTAPENDLLRRRLHLRRLLAAGRVRGLHPPLRPVPGAHRAGRGLRLLDARAGRSPARPSRLDPRGLRPGRAPARHHPDRRVREDLRARRRGPAHRHLLPGRRRGHLPHRAREADRGARRGRPAVRRRPHQRLELDPRRRGQPRLRAPRRGRGGPGRRVLRPLRADGMMGG